MPVGQLITLGVGTPSSIPLLTLTGLFPSSGSGGGGGNIPIGPPSVLVGNVIYALPARAVNIDWLATVATILEISIDQVTWITIDSSSSASYVTNVCAIYIRPSATITATLKRYRNKL